MKKLIFAALLCLGAFTVAQAQETNTQPTTEDYERMIRNMENIEFRSQVIESLGLTSEQINDFDPLYRSYMRDKNELAKRKYALLEDFSDEYAHEIAEGDTKEAEDEAGDFIENYWEVEIAAMELKKDYFDRMEDKIGVDNAFAFFMMEDIVENGMKKRIIEKRYVPIFIEVEKPAPSTSTGSTNKSAPSSQPKAAPSNTYKADIDAFSNWVLRTNGKEDLSHQYTHDGLNSLMNAITALHMARNVNTTDFSQQKQRVISLADQLQVDKYSTEHADYAREAFTIAADMLKTLQEEGGYKVDNLALMEVSGAAAKIDPNKLMLPQKEHVYNFFRKAQVAVNSMANSISWASNQ